MDIENLVTRETLDKDYSEMKKYWDEYCGDKRFERKADLIKKLRKSIFVNSIILAISIAAVVFASIVLVKTVITAKASHDLYKADKLAIIQRSNEDLNKYYDKETYEYLLEVFPIGKVDVQGFEEGIDLDENERLIKTTWYNKARTKVVATDYQLINLE